MNKISIQTIHISSMPQTFYPVLKTNSSKKSGRRFILQSRMTQSKDLSYIPKILSCFLIEDLYLPQLDAYRKQFIQFQELDADMRRLSIISKILMKKRKQPGSRLFFGGNYGT